MYSAETNGQELVAKSVKSHINTLNKNTCTVSLFTHTHLSVLLTTRVYPGICQLSSNNPFYEAPFGVLCDAVNHPHEHTKQAFSK